MTTDVNVSTLPGATTAALAEVRSNVIGGPVFLEVEATCPFLLPLSFLCVCVFLCVLCVVEMRVEVATGVAEATGLVMSGGVAVGRAKVVGVLPGIAGAVDVAPIGAVMGGVSAVAVEGMGVSVLARAVTGGGDCVIGIAVEAMLGDVAVAAATVRVAEGLLVMIGTLDGMMVGRDGVGVFVTTGVAVALVVGIVVIVGALGAVLVALGVRDGDRVAVSDAVCIAVADGILAVAVGVPVAVAVGVLLCGIAGAVGVTPNDPGVVTVGVLVNAGSLGPTEGVEGAVGDAMGAATEIVSR